MAELITTQEENDSNSFLDWDDASLGRLVKKSMLDVQDASKDADGTKKVMAVSAFMLICGVMVDLNLEELYLSTGEFTHNGKFEGMWDMAVGRLVK